VAGSLTISSTLLNRMPTPPKVAPDGRGLLEDANGKDLYCADRHLRRNTISRVFLLGSRGNGRRSCFSGDGEVQVFDAGLT